MMRTTLLLALLLGLLACGDSTAAGADAAAAGSPEDRALALVARARAAAESNRDAVPDDACRLEDDWRFEVLHDLSLAAALAPEKTVRALDTEPIGSDSDSGSGSGFADTDHYQKWRKAVPVARDVARVRELVIGSEWWPYRASFPHYWLRFEEDGRLVKHTYEAEEVLGTWKQTDAGVSARLADGTALTPELESRKYHFDEGRKWFYHLYLSVDGAGEELPWTDPLILGPPAGDCGEYNF